MRAISWVRKYLMRDFPPCLQFCEPIPHQDEAGRALGQWHLGTPALGLPEFQGKSSGLCLCHSPCILVPSRWGDTVLLLFPSRIQFRQIGRQAKVHFNQSIQAPLPFGFQSFKMSFLSRCAYLSYSAQGAEVFASASVFPSPMFRQANR